jgi:Rrf2 family protein
VRVTLKTEYALRALAALARHAPDLVKTETLVTEERLPRDFAQLILGELRRAGLVHTRRGSDGGYALAVPAEEVTVGDVIRVVDGPLTQVPALLPEQTGTPSGDHLARLWAAVATSVEAVLDGTTLADVASGRLPERVESLAVGSEPRARAQRRW